MNLLRKWILFFVEYFENAIQDFTKVIFHAMQPIRHNIWLTEKNNIFYEEKIREKTIQNLGENT